MPLAFGVQSLKHWTAREVPTLFFFFSLLVCVFILLPHKSLKNIFYAQMYFIAYAVLFLGDYKVVYNFLKVPKLSKICFGLSYYYNYYNEMDVTPLLQLVPEYNFLVCCVLSCV